MQQTSVRQAGTDNIPAVRSESIVKLHKEPLKVTQDAVDAYEKRSGFYGIGKKMVEHGRWEIVTKEETPCRQI